MPRGPLGRRGFVPVARPLARGALTSLDLSGNDLAGLPALVLPLVVASIVTVMTEVTSNTATASIFLPVFFEAAKHPAAMVLPATLACSLAFMLPNATPPNAIAFSTGVLEVRHMLLPGLFLNAVGVLGVAFWCSIVGRALF